MYKHLLEREYDIVADGIEISKSWSDIHAIDEKRKLAMANKYKSEAIMEEIFKELYRLQVRYIEGKKKKSFQEQTEDAIVRAISKATKKINERVNLIAAVDPLMGLGNKVDQYECKEHDKFIERVTKGEIIVVGVTTYFSDWFRNLNIKPAQIRVYCPRDIHKFDHDNVIPFRNHKKILYRKDDEKLREIFILGGTSTFKKLYSRVTDIYFTHFENIMPNVDQYFSVINFGALGIISSDSSVDDNGETIARTHLRWGKKVTPEWKNTKDQMSGRTANISVGRRKK